MKTSEYKAGVDFSDMLRSGQFSDLTLVCQGKEFKIHKLVACPQSPVFSAAVNGEFKVSKETDFSKAGAECGRRRPGQASFKSNSLTPKR